MVCIRVCVRVFNLGFHETERRVTSKISMRLRDPKSIQPLNQRIIDVYFSHKDRRETNTFYREKLK